MSTITLRTRKHKIETAENAPIKAEPLEGDSDVENTPIERSLRPRKTEPKEDTVKVEDSLLESRILRSSKIEPQDDTVEDSPLGRKILRPRKKVDYHLYNDTTDQAEDSDVGYSAIQSESGSDTESGAGESSGSEFFSKKKRKIDDTHSIDASLIKVLQNVDESDDENEYRRQRQKNMEDRFKVLRTLEFEDDKKELKSVTKSTPKSKPKSSSKPVKKVSKTPLPTSGVKRSLRLQNRSLNLSFNSTRSDSELQFGTEKLIKEETYDRITDENLPFVDEETEEDFSDALNNLKNDMCIPYEVNDDFRNCDIDQYSEIVKSCQMNGSPIKIIKQRIVSMDFHPSSKKLILIAGDKHGNIALRELSQETGIEFKAHAYNVNCITFGKQDNTKFFSTSLDGTVRQGDVNSSNLQLVYNSADDSHTTWHHEFGHSLLVAEGHDNFKGDGIARLIDVRAPVKECVSFKCHKKSMRTVQLHPTNENYFLTSSGVGEFCIWDMRLGDSKNLEPLIKQKLDKALTSAFFSAKGNSVLTTCNDDTIRVYDVSTLKKAVQEVRISHNNHCGRWLSVFKARWHPEREDAFFVGSMISGPNRIQIYRRNGKIISQLVSSEMTTYNPVIVAHPTQPIFVGGNGSGRVHVFSPYTSLTEISS